MIRTLDVSRLNTDQINVLSEQIAKFESYHLAGQACQPINRALADTGSGDSRDGCSTAGSVPGLPWPERGGEELSLENIEDAMSYLSWAPDQFAAGNEVREMLTLAAKAVLRHVPRCPRRTLALQHLISARMDANAAISFRGRF